MCVCVDRMCDIWCICSRNQRRMSGTNTRVLLIVYFIPPHIIVNFAGTLQGLFVCKRSRLFIFYTLRTKSPLSHLIW